MNKAIVVAMIMLAPVLAVAKTVVIEWDQNNPADEVASYEAHVGNTSGVYNVVFDLGLGVEHADHPTPAFPGQKLLRASFVLADVQADWFIALRAVDVYGEPSEGFSNEVSFDTFPPNNPSGLIIISISE